MGLYRWVSFAAVFALCASPAAAQYKPRPLDDPATGEKYHIEAAGDLWFPSADVRIASESLGIVGSNIDFKRDLGLTDKRMSAVQIVLRPAKSHKFRFEYIPITYTSSATLSTNIIFNGIRYTIGLPVNSSLEWKAYRFGYEYDFITKNRGFAGFILEAKYTDVRVELDSPFAAEFAHAARADSGARRHRPLLRGAEHLDHRRSDRVQDPRQHRQSGTTRTLSTSTSTAR